MSRIWTWLLARPKPTEQPPRILPLSLGAVCITVAIVLPHLPNGVLAALRGPGILIIGVTLVTAAFLVGVYVSKRRSHR